MTEQQLIIVSKGKIEEKMAKRISAFISQDGRFEALCWTEKHYEATIQTISSSQYCLFIGETSEYEANRFGMKWHYDQCGMKYGWIGRKAFLVTEQVSDEQRKEFAEIFVVFAEIEKFKEDYDFVFKILRWTRWINFYSALAYFIINKIDEVNLKEFQYIYLVNKFCKDGLPKFMGVSE